MDPTALPTSGTTDPNILASIVPETTAGQQAVLLPFPVSAAAAAAAAPVESPAAVGFAATTEQAAPAEAPTVPFTDAAASDAAAAARYRRAGAFGGAGGGVTVQATPPSAFQGLLDSHNSYRATHGVPALVWDDTLAADVNAHLPDFCRNPDNPPTSGVGLNVYFRSFRSGDTKVGQTISSSTPEW